MGSARTGGAQRWYFPGDHRNHQAPQEYERPGRGRRDRHRAGPRDLRCEEGGVGDFRPVITAVRPPRAGRSRRPHGQLCRDSGTPHRLRHAARSKSAATPAAMRTRGQAHNSQAVDQDCGGKGAPIRRSPANGPPRCPPNGASHWSLLAGQFSKNRSLSAYPLLVGLEFPAGEFVPPVLYLPRAGGAAVHSSISFHPRRLGRALEQALTLHRLIRAQIGVAGLVAYRGDHQGAAGDFRGGFLLAAFEAAVETKPRPGFGKLVPTATIWHLVLPRLPSDRRVDDLSLRPSVRARAENPAAQYRRCHRRAGAQAARDRSTGAVTLSDRKRAAQRGRKPTSGVARLSGPLV